ncbi:MAG: T9SS type A sorting domain-containing protein, partial [Bacteroidetes bacterium]|nr:T9SS type A sorting domain-containing protein [Bacteroidota bacterium]
ACCAANPGMAPGGNGALKAAPATGEVKEQRLLIIPNPVADLTTLEYYVPQAGKVSLSISNSDGKPMGMLREEQAEPGAYTYQWNTTELASGTYFCTYMLDGAVVVKRAVKVK